MLVYNEENGGNEAYNSVQQKARAVRNGDETSSAEDFSEKLQTVLGVCTEDMLNLIIREFRYLMGQKEGARVLNITDAIRPIAQIAFEFATEAELAGYQGRISTLVYAVLKVV